MNTRNATPDSERGPARMTRNLLAATMATAALLAGCATPLDARKDTAYQQHASVANRPVVRPVRSVSSSATCRAAPCSRSSYRASRSPC